MQDYHLINPTQELQPFEFEVATLADQGELPGGGRQLNVQRQRQQADQHRENLGDGISLEMVAIPGGTFLMGSPETESWRRGNESPQHSVTVPAFFLGRYPITQAQWSAVASLPQINQELKPDPSRFKGSHRPVEQVSWNHATEFCARLSVYTGRTYRLPSEAEWEYACRAGTTTPFHFGATITTDLANYVGINTYGEGTKGGEYRAETTPVDHFGIANSFGLCEMHGNVWEWCQDHWHENYEGAPTDGSAWSHENDNNSHVIRGGSWFYSPWNCRSASRLHFISDFSHIDLGFRVVCVLPRTS